MLLQRRLAVAWLRGASSSGARRLSLPAPPPFAERRRVVVTGIGLVTPLGVGAQRSWDALVAGEVATRRLEGAEFAALPCRVAGTVPRGSGAGLFDAEALPHAPASRNAPFVQMALVAADEALADADGGAASQHRTINGVWGDGAEARCAVCVGSGIGALSEIVSAGAAVNKGQHRKVSPFFVPKVLLNMAGAQIAIRHGIRGPNHTLVTACAAGAHNIIDAAKLIALGDADVALAGGSESCVEPLALAGFARAKALATDFNDSPLEASRPFDAKRCGFVMGEGAGVVVLEEYEIAKRRGAKIYAEVRGWAQAASARESGCDWLGRDTLKRKHVHVCMHKHAHTPRNAHIQRTAHKQVRGWGSGGDAYHITSPVEDGTGAAHVMQQALSVAGLPPSAVFLVYVSNNTRPHSPPPIPPCRERARTHTHMHLHTHAHAHTGGAHQLPRNVDTHGRRDRDTRHSACIPGLPRPAHLLQQGQHGAFARSGWRGRGCCDDPFALPPKNPRYCQPGKAVRGCASGYQHRQGPRTGRVRHAGGYVQLFWVWRRECGAPLRSGVEPKAPTTSLRCTISEVVIRWDTRSPGQ